MLRRAELIPTNSRRINQSIVETFVGKDPFPAKCGPPRRPPSADYSQQHRRQGLPQVFFGCVQSLLSLPPTCEESLTSRRESVDQPQTRQKRADEPDVAFLLPARPEALSTIARHVSVGSNSVLRRRRRYVRSAFESDRIADIARGRRRAMRRREQVQQ